MAAKKTVKKTAAKKSTKTSEAEKPWTQGGPAAVAKQSYKTVPVDQLVEHPDNPRRGDEAMIARSIAENDFYGVVLVQAGTNRILAGNHRWKAAKQVGLKKIPVVFVEVDDVRARRILLADNRTSDAAGYDDGALLAALQAVAADQNNDLAGTGFEPADLVELLAATQPPPPATPKHSKQSQIKHVCPKCKYEWTGGAEEAPKKAGRKK